MTIAVAQPSATSRFATVAIDAVRAMRWPQIRAASLLALGYVAWSWVVFLRANLYLAQYKPLGYMLLFDLAHSEIKALCLVAAIVIADRAVEEGAPRRRAYVLAALVGCVAGVVLSEPIARVFDAYVMSKDEPPGFPWLRGTAGLFYWPIKALMHWLLIAGAVVFFYADRRAARKTAQLLHDAELERTRRSRIALESRLQAMQARVEPRFLLNTLTQVERLYELDASLAARMLDDLIAYLRAAMPLMRDTSSTVAQEIELARTYLEIVRVRSGQRVSVRTQTLPDAAGVRMPPMMLLPLIDHAIGRGPQVPSASRRISMDAGSVAGRRLVVTVRDSGPGFVPDADQAGITAIRERLEALYGTDASLELRRDGDETLARLDLPLERHAVES